MTDIQLQATWEEILKNLENSFYYLKFEMNIFKIEID